MGTLIDRTGQKYNKLTFTKPADKGKWELLCDCGNSTFAKSATVILGHKKSCGCLKHKPQIRKDWVGIKINRLLFIGSTHTKKAGHVIWELLCDCGATVYSAASRVANGHTKSCGCLKIELDRKDWAGQKYGMLTFVSPIDKRTSNAVVWKLLCDCGNTTFSIGSSVVRGNKSSCGCYFKIQARKSKNRKYKPHITSARTIWKGSYKDGCDFDTFLNLSQLPCYYCNRLPHRTYNAGGLNRVRPGSEEQIAHGDFTYNGLDRIDSSKDHAPDNIVTCCYDCNTAKSAMSLDKFLELIQLIYTNRCI